MAIFLKTCEICGKQIEVKTTRQRYCFICGEKENRKHNEAWRKKYAIAPNRFCKKCGIAIAKNRSYCEECSEKRKQELLQQQIQRKKTRLQNEMKDKKRKFEDIQNILATIDISKYAKKR